MSSGLQPSRTHISAEAAAAAAAEEPARARFQWKYPDTPAEKKSMAVFEDLWARGFCVASGSSYGADYVVYDGKRYVYGELAGSYGVRWRQFDSL